MRTLSPYETQLELSMTTSAVLLHAAVETVEPDCGPANYAIELAAAFDAHLTGLVFQLDVTSPQTADGIQETTNLNATFDARNRDAIRRAEQLRRHAGSLGISVEILTKHSHAYTVPHVAADHARLCDFVVAGVSEAGLLSERAIAEYVLFQSGRPLIALPFLRRAVEVTLLTVDADKAIDTSLTSAQVLASLHRRGVLARFEQIERQGQSIGDAIQRYALQRGSHLLVMGGYGHSRFRDFVLGGATRQILASPELPTLLSH